MMYRKADFTAAHPGKLYRKIFDVCEDEMSRKKYAIDAKNSHRPQLSENQIYGSVSDFDCDIRMIKSVWSVNMTFAIIGIVIIAAGVISILYGSMNRFEMYSSFSYIIGIILIIVGMITIFLKSWSHLAIKIKLYGETYAINTHGDESDEFSVKSDVRLNVTYGHINYESLTCAQENILQHDIRFFYDKLDELFQQEKITLQEV